MKKIQSKIDHYQTQIKKIDNILEGKLSKTAKDVYRELRKEFEIRIETLNEVMK